MIWGVVRMLNPSDTTQGHLIWFAVSIPRLFVCLECSASCACRTLSMSTSVCSKKLLCDAGRAQKGCVQSIPSTFCPYIVVSAVPRCLELEMVSKFVVYLLFEIVSGQNASRIPVVCGQQGS